MRMPGDRIRVFLADDNLIVREGVRALLSLADDIDVIGVAADYDELVDGAGRAAPQVVVTDIRMPPTFQAEGIQAAREVRRLHPGTGIVILSQFDEPEYAVSLLADGAAGCAYLLKDRVAEGDQLVRAVRGEVYDVAVDLRPDSDAFGRWCAVELTAANRRMLYVPDGVAHGFETREDSSEVFYQISRSYEPHAARGVRWDDPAFPQAFPWFAEPRYWEQHYRSLEEQLTAVVEPALEL